MKRSTCFAIFVICLGAGRTSAQDRGFGLGFVTGEPTGLSAKIWTGPSNALQFSLAWRNADRFFGNRVSVTGDYLWHQFDAIHSSPRLTVYYGIGAD